ncbi:hypothetical protein WJX74_005171 [Apatococcus lobatus]|uniref:Uncharacterized protein n=1 Tax=Apatococcus lobatus TaxID=904363 RepID=A0AAW1RDM6_9CHLO
MEPANVSRSSYVVEDGGGTGAKVSITRLNAPALPYTHVPGSLKQVRGNHAISRKRARQAQSPAATASGKPVSSALDHLPNFRSLEHPFRGSTAGSPSLDHVGSWPDYPRNIPPMTRAQSMQHIPGPLMVAQGDVLSRSVPGAPHNPLDDYQLFDADQGAAIQSPLIDQEACQLELPPLPAFPVLYRRPQQPQAHQASPAYSTAAPSHQSQGQWRQLRHAHPAESHQRPDGSSSTPAQHDHLFPMALLEGCEQAGLSDPPPHPITHPPRNPTPMTVREPSSPLLAQHVIAQEGQGRNSRQKTVNSSGIPSPGMVPPQPAQQDSSVPENHLHGCQNQALMDGAAGSGAPSAAHGQALGLRNLWYEAPGWDLRRAVTQPHELQQMAGDMRDAQASGPIASRCAGQVSNSLEEALILQSQEAARVAPDITAVPQNDFCAFNAALPQQSAYPHADLKPESHMQHVRRLQPAATYSQNTNPEPRRAASDPWSLLPGPPPDDALPWDAQPEPYAYARQPTWNASHPDGMHESALAESRVLLAPQDHVRSAVAAEQAGAGSQSLPAYLDRHVIVAQQEQASSSPRQAHIQAMQQSMRNQASLREPAGFRAMLTPLRHSADLEESLVQSARAMRSGSLQPPTNAAMSAHGQSSQTPGPLQPNDVNVSSNTAAQEQDMHAFPSRPARQALRTDLPSDRNGSGSTASASALDHHALRPLLPLFSLGSLNTADQHQGTHAATSALDHHHGPPLLLPIFSLDSLNTADQQPGHQDAALQEGPVVALPQAHRAFPYQPLCDDPHIPRETGMYDDEAFMQGGLLTSGAGPWSHSERLLPNPANLPRMHLLVWAPLFRPLNRHCSSMPAIANSDLMTTVARSRVLISADGLSAGKGRC